MTNTWFLLAAAIAFIATPAPAATFADVVTVDLVSENATGVLAGVAFTVQSTRAAPRPITGDNGGVVSAITDGTSTAFASGVFTPSLPLGDSVLLGAASDFRITFAQPISNITLHIWQLQANRLSFTSRGIPVAFTLLSSDGDFTVSGGSTAIQGSSSSADDANGSLLFPGALSELSWTSAVGVGANSNTPEDGIRIQASVVPELSSSILILSGLLILIAKSSRRLRNSRSATEQFAPTQALLPGVA